MFYQYKNEETEEVIEKDFSMKNDIPSKIEENGKVFYRVWTNSFHIPFQWGKESGFNFKKSPSGRKHFF